MTVVLFIQMALALAVVAGQNTEWEPLEKCIQRLKEVENEISNSITLRTVTPLDRRLNFMIEGIRYSELNSTQLKNFVGTTRSDRLAPYLVINATVACQRDEIRLGTYVGGLQKFLFMFFITTVSIALYGAYLFNLLLRFQLKDR